MGLNLKTALLSITSGLAFMACSDSGVTAPDAPQAQPAATATQKPNVIFILVDDMGFGDVSYNGSEIATPELAQMAAEGVQLDRNYVFPICSPTRTALMTGHSALNYGVDGPMSNKHVVEYDAKFLPSYFKDAGYDTWMVGKWHLGLKEIEAFPRSRGFDYNYGFLGGFVDFYTHVYWDGLDWQRNGKTLREEGHVTDLLTADAIRKLEAHDGENPFFMYLAYNAPHTPLQYPPNMKGDYAEIDDMSRRVYAQMMSHLDERIGDVRDTLVDLGIDGETIVVFSSDNGGQTRGGGANNGLLRGSKGAVYEGGMRVPGIVAWPSVLQGGQKMEAPMFMQNWAPTLLDAAGVNVAAGTFEGKSAWAAISGDANAPLPQPTILGAVGNVAVFDWPHKLVSIAARGNNAASIELYNVVDDPYEKTDIASANSDIVARLTKVMDARKIVPSKRETGEPPEALYRNEDGSTNFDVRLKETTSPWAERATGNGG